MTESRCSCCVNAPYHSRSRADYEAAQADFEEAAKALTDAIGRMVENNPDVLKPGVEKLIKLLGLVDELLPEQLRPEWRELRGVMLRFQMHQAILDRDRVAATAARLKAETMERRWR